MPYLTLNSISRLNDCFLHSNKKANCKRSYLSINNQINSLNSDPNNPLNCNN